jgi:predicted tellurium resistance membrane protein TerC
MEVVLGIDNIIFITILVGKLPTERRKIIRQIGIGLALVSRLGLLATLSWMMKLTQPLFTLPIVNHPISGRDLILIVGGLFLLGKSSHEIYDKLEGAPATEPGDKPKHPADRSLRNLTLSILAQVIVLDIVFSLDSVITAVGMAQQIWVMVVAMLISVGVMLAAAGAIGDFVERHPALKILALAFLLLIGVMLLAEGFGQHINKGYIYFAMAFSVLVELVNMRVRKKSAPVQLHKKIEKEPITPGAPADATRAAP